MRYVPRQSLRCPRCDRDTMRAKKVENALSRTTRGVNDEAVYVCSPCGTDEGMQDYFAFGDTPKSEWPLESLTYVLPTIEERINQ